MQSDRISDKELWRLVAQEDDRTAFEQLYRRSLHALMSVIYKWTDDQAEAEDVLQEAFLDAFNKIKDFRQETTFGLWLKQIVVNRSINLLRKRKMDLNDLEGDQLENIPDEEAEDDEEVLFKVAQVKDAMKLLPEGYRVVLSLYLLEGYDHEEIGQILNISENTSRTQFLRAKRKLMEILKNRGIA